MEGGLVADGDGAVALEWPVTGTTPDLPQNGRRPSVRNLLPAWAFTRGADDGNRTRTVSLESASFALICRLTSGATGPQVTVRHPRSPGLMAR